MGDSDSRSNSTSNMDKLFGKANKLLGIDESTALEVPRPSTLFRNNNALATTTSSFLNLNLLNMNVAAGVGTVSLQRAGVLYRKPFYASINPLSPWKKSYFVLKDAFLFWYKSQPKPTSKHPHANFSLYPEGLLPLAGCTVHPEGRDHSSNYLFSIASNYTTNVLWLRTNSEADAAEWISLISACRDSNYENAMFGDAQTVFLASKGGKSEKETAKLLEEARIKAEESERRRLEGQEIMEDQMKKKRQWKRELGGMKGQIELQEKEMERQRKELDLRKEKVEMEEGEKKVLEEKLEKAKEAVEKLQLAVLEKMGPNKERLLRDILQLKNFLSIDY